METFKAAVKENQIAIIELLIKDNSDIDIQWALKYAIKHELLEITKVLLKHPEIDLNSKNFSFCYVCDYGLAEFVKLLAADPRTKLDIYSNLPIRLASKNGHHEVVRELLKYPQRVNPADAIVWAAEYGHEEVVKVLLQDERVDPSTNDNCPLEDAIKNEHLGVVKTLLNDKRVVSSCKFFRFVFEKSNNTINKATLECLCKGKPCKLVTKDQNKIVLIKEIKDLYHEQKIKEYPRERRIYNINDNKFLEHKIRTP